MNIKQKPKSYILGLLIVFSFNTYAAFQDKQNIQAFQKEIMAKITGKTEIIPGTKIPDRSTLKNKKIVRTYFETVFKALGYEPIRQIYSEEGENIYVTLKATVNSDEYIILGAHYDSPGNAGANDNASGCAVVLAVAKQIKALEKPFKKFNICFI